MISCRYSINKYSATLTPVRGVLRVRSYFHQRQVIYPRYFNAEWHGELDREILCLNETR